MTEMPGMPGMPRKRGTLLMAGITECLDCL